MKRCTALATALWLMACSTPVTGESAPTPTPAAITGYTLRLSSDEMIVFSTSSMKANIVGYIRPDTAENVTILSISGDWCYVSFPSTYGTGFGYVPLSYFDAAAVPTPTPIPEASFAAGTAAWVANNGEGYRLHLREMPDVQAKSLGKYYTSTALTLTGAVRNGFAQVLLAGTTLGWMDVRFLTTDASNLVPETPLVTVNNPDSGAVLRSGPGTSYSRLNRYEHGTAVTVLGVRNDGWYHVMIQGEIGYIAETLLSGTFPYEYGTDSDNPTLHNSMVNSEMQFYINTRSTGGQLHLRKSASTSAKSLGLFYTGTPLTVISYTRTGWAYVRIGQTEGYVDANYLVSSKPTQYGQSRTVSNNRATGLNLRSLPSTGGEILAFADNYSQITVLGELSDGWCYVSYQGILGYMLGTNLK